MSNLVSVRGPHARGPMDNIRVQWNMGNSCNYECEYCPSILHDGSKPWLPLESYLTTIERLSQHYNDMGKRVDYELIGGEVTVIPGFEDIIRKISEYNISYSVLDNSFQILYTPAIQRDVVVSPPHKIGALRNTFFNRIIVCVEKHPFYVNALPASNFKWICRKLTLQPSEKECKFIGCSINKLKKRMIIVNSDRTV